MEGIHSYRFPFAKYPAVRLALLFSGGIILSRQLGGTLSFWVILCAFILGLGFLFNFLAGKYLHSLYYRMSIVLYLAGAFVFGGCWYQLNGHVQPPHTQKVLDAYVWEPLTFKGEIHQLRHTASGKIQADVYVRSTHIDSNLTWEESYYLRCILDSSKTSIPARLKLGDHITFRATVYPLEARRNPYEFDYKSYLASQNIFNQAGIDSIYRIRPPSSSFSWNVIRQKTLEIIDRNFDSATAPLAKALLIGYKNNLERDQKIAFSRVGLSHIMAVSGLHVGFLLAPFWIIVPFFWTFKYGRQIGLLVLILSLFFYAGLTGFSASVSRAAVTGGFIMYGRLFNKVRDSKNLTALAALLILLVDPSQLFQIGFQLSFAAVYIILLTLPVLSSYLPAWVRYRWYGAPIMIVLVSIVVQIGLFPLLSYYFGEFSLVGPLANAVVVPFLTLIVPYALFLLPLSALLPTAGYFLNIPSRYFLNYLYKFVQTASGWDGSWIQTHLVNPWLFVIWLAALFFIAVLRIPRLRWKMLCVLLATLCVQQSIQIYQKMTPARLEVTVFDVGQGDATLVKTPGGRYVMIDTGRWTPGYNSATYILIPYLKARGIQKLDAVFLSHPHADHIGGVAELIRHIPVGAIYNSGFSYDSELYKNYLKLAAKKHIPVHAVRAGDQVAIDPAMRVYIYGPSPLVGSSDPNEHSVVMELVYGSTQFLFMGDAGYSEEATLPAFGKLVDTDFLKVGHHGSRTGSSETFLETATPSISVVSLAKSNRYKHPHAEAVRRLRKNSGNVAFTSLSGALVFTSDGDSIRQENWK